MALIEVDTGVFFDTEKTWYGQSVECIELGQAVMLTTPTAIEMEACESGGERMLSGTWRTTTATGTFDMGVARIYLYPATSKAYMTKSEQDTVTVTEVI